MVISNDNDDVDDNDNDNDSDEEEDDDGDTQVAQWSQCSKTCGSGQQGRVIQCIGDFLFTPVNHEPQPIPNLSQT